MFFNSQVVERERNDSKAEQERLNTQIQEISKEVEVILNEIFFSGLTLLPFWHCREERQAQKTRKRR